MRKIPMPFKLTISTIFSGAMAYMLYNDNLYDGELYAMALKYRKEYDEEYNKMEEISTSAGDNIF
jgi:hypothetical protein